jgi:hypothetical protein
MAEIAGSTLGPQFRIILGDSRFASWVFVKKIGSSVSVFKWTNPYPSQSDIFTRLACTNCEERTLSFSFSTFPISPSSFTTKLQEVTYSGESCRSKRVKSLETIRELQIDINHWQFTTHLLCFEDCFEKFWRAVQKVGEMESGWGSKFVKRIVPSSETDTMEGEIEWKVIAPPQFI